MKKVSVFMVLCLCMMLMTPVLAAADTVQETEYKTYTDEEFGYQLNYPANWIVIGLVTIDGVLSQITEGGIQVEGFTETALEALKSTLESGAVNHFVEFAELSGSNITANCFAYPMPASIADAKALLAPRLYSSINRCSAI